MMFEKKKNRQTLQTDDRSENLKEKKTPSLITRNTTQRENHFKVITYSTLFITIIINTQKRNRPRKRREEQEEEY
jgi:hypothetical protein